MVISVLAGGLGNQLFQYAFGFRLSQQLQTDLRLEQRLLTSKTLARLRHYTPRLYELDAFAISGTRTSTGDIIRCLSRTLLPGQPSVFLRESDTNALENLPANTKDVLCLGYWQSENYFDLAADALRRELVFRKQPSALTLAIAEAIAACPNATFVHIRRGDYVTNSRANQHHGLCDKAYYQRSANYLRQRLTGTHFFVFSDDQAWVKQELGTLFQPATFVEHNTSADSWQDLYLMGLCRHAVLANSSFSWWGAWLNAVADRLVISPQQWFANQPRLSQQIILPNWITL